MPPNSASDQKERKPAAEFLQVQHAVLKESRYPTQKPQKHREISRINVVTENIDIAGIIS